MYYGMQKMEEILQYIEENITSEISCDTLSKKMNLSVYEFRRIFSFVIGCPVSEYIRKRRLSLAACEIMTSEKVNLSVLSEKYQYANQSAFTKAFKAHHGFTPAEYLKNPREIKLFTVPKMDIRILSGETVPLKIINEPEFHIEGYTGLSTITDTCCCENVWNEFYETGSDKKLSSDEIYVSYHNYGDSVSCCIGEKSRRGKKISAASWAVFRLDTTDDEKVNEIYSKIIYEWLASADLEKDEKMPVIEVYPYDMSKDGFIWEIRIPIKI